MHSLNFTILVFALIMELVTSKIACAKDIQFQRHISLLPEQASLALIVKYPEDPKPLISYRSELYQPPASTVKIATGLAAKLYLGDDFVFDTTLEVSGRNIILRFSGDPSLKSKDVALLLTEYKKQYGSKIRGDIILDSSVFDGQEWAQGVTWESLSACYSAPSSAISLDHNCVYGRLNSHFPVGKVAKVQIPPDKLVYVESTARIVTESESKRRSCTLDASLALSNKYTVSGCISQSERPIPLIFSVQDTRLYAKSTIERLLKKANIQLQGKIKIASAKPGRVVSRHISNPLPSILQSMIADSDNLIADNLTKMLGHVYFQQPGNFINGTEAIVAILREKAGIDLSSAYLADGSGLSRNNRVTASQVMEVLEYIYQHDKKLGMLDLFPVSGISGTLKNRKSLQSEKLKGKIKAKTGTIFSTYNLAGVIEAGSGKPLLFVQMVTDYLPLQERRKPANNEIDTDLDRFEKSIYTDLVNWK